MIRYVISSSIFLLSLFSVACTGVAYSQIPSTPLKGLAGLDQAIQIQLETGKAIILWSTWNTCPNTRKVAEWFSSPQVSHSLKDFPRVILESKGNSDEVLESEIRGFEGGNFYIIADYNFEPDSYNSVWAWNRDGKYTMKKDLLNQIMQIAR